MLHRTVLKPRFIILVLLLFLPAIVTAAEPISLDNYLLGYSYDSRKEMKASSKQACSINMQHRKRELTSAWRACDDAPYFIRIQLIYVRKRAVS